MEWEKELQLLRDTLKRCRIASGIISPFEPIHQAMDSPIWEILSARLEKKNTVKNRIGLLREKTLYKYTDEYQFCYLYLPLSQRREGSVLLVGPYLLEPISSHHFLEMGERIGVPPKSQRYFKQLYQNVPVLSEGDSVFVMLDTFCEHLWETSSFSIYNVNAMESAVLPSLPDTESRDRFDEEWMNIKTMEIRYQFENELMEAVAKGQLHKEKTLLSLFSDKMLSFSDKLFEKRVSDPLRNAKNYGIIMNTLLRKAAEQGGVHPVHIDKMSSDFAHRIEHLSSLSENGALMIEMFRSYCKLVRKHAIRNFSPVIQKAILLIESDLSADLSLGTLAKQQSISPAYLSSLFKKETGKTLSEYIREKRISYAASLLDTTHLQVQTVAQHCGIMDVQYFSKLFKKQMGKTPKEYRLSQRQLT